MPFVDSLINFVTCGNGRRKEITSHFDSRYGAPDISAPNEGAYTSPSYDPVNPDIRTKPRAPYEPTNLPRIVPKLLAKEGGTGFSASHGGPYGLAPLKVRTHNHPTTPGSPQSTYSASQTSARISAPPASPTPQHSPAFSTGSATTVSTPHASVPVHSAYISGYSSSSSPPNSGNPLSDRSASASSHHTSFKFSPTFASSNNVASSPSSTATTPLNPQYPSSPQMGTGSTRLTSPPLLSMVPAASSTDPNRMSQMSQGSRAGRDRSERQIPNFVMTTNPNSPPFAGTENRKTTRPQPHVVIGDVPAKKGKGDFKGSPDSEMSVEQWPGSM